MKPIVKWAGGKTKLLPELLPRVPKKIGTYAEPFAGGAALFFALAHERARGKRAFARAILTDMNQDLVACYSAVRDDVERVIVELGSRQYKYNRDLYYRARERDPRELTDIQRAARFIYLNRTCYNGLWRVNSKGKFNVPFGRYKNPTILDPDGLREASRLLAGVEVRLGDFETATEGLERGDFVYFDPPYVPVSKTSDFTAYAAGGFDDGDQRRLVRRMQWLHARGVGALLSNADTSVTRKLYEGFTTEKVLVPRSINRDASKRGEIGELLVTNRRGARASAKARHAP